MTSSKVSGLMCADFLRTMHLQGGGLIFRTCIKRLWTLESMVWLVIGLGTAVLTVVPIMSAGLLTLVSVVLQAKSGETAEQPGPSKKGVDAGPSGDKKLWIPKGEVAVRKAAKVCMWCGLEGHVGKDCKNPRSLTPSFAKGG